jgi:hypothetical protein
MAQARTSFLSTMRRREITTKGLAEFVIKRVRELAKGMIGKQEPQYFRGRDAEDNVLARW